MDRPTVFAIALVLGLAVAGCATSSAASDETSTTAAAGAAPATDPAGTATAGTDAASTAASTTAPPTTVPPTTVPPTTTLPLPGIIAPAVLPDVQEAASLGPLPEGSNAGRAAGDEPLLYGNGCHVSWNDTTPKQGCFYGDTSSDTLVAVVGDSHAAAWFGAFDEAGKANHWKILMVTKAGCPAADVTIYSAANPNNHNVVYTQCDEWRPNALAYVTSLEPTLIVFPLLSRRAVVGLPGAAGIEAWAQGLGSTIDVAKASGAKVLVLGDVPKTIGTSIPACVGGHRNNVGACANQRSLGVKTERLLPLAAAAEQHGATFVDVSNWFCTDAVCPVVIDGIVVYRDEHHMTDTFSRYRGPQVAESITAALATR